MRIVVVGGGIGGLTLGQGLRRRGFDVVVVEKDRDLACTGGYKLHLGTTAVAALRGLLPPTLLELLLSSAVGTPAFRLAVRDHRCRLLLLAADDGGDGTSLDVDRITLRLVLAEGLGDCLLTGRRAVGYQDGADRVIVELDDGNSLEADVVVAADGPGSMFTDKLAGQVTARPTGLVGVAGRTRWADLPVPVRDLLSTDPMLAVGPGGCGLFATAHDPVGSPAIRGFRSLSSTKEPIAIWGLIATDDLLPPQLGEVRSRQLLDRSCELLEQRGWSPTVGALLAASIESSVGGYRLLAADPTRIAPWPAGRVTALGDAVHAMPPTGGQGAATAIRDAALLTERLDAARRGECTVRVAIHDYEEAMRAYARVAVRESLQPVRWIRATATSLGSAVARGALPGIAAGHFAASRLRRLIT